MKSKIIEDLMWRYATKRFDPSKKVSDQDVEEVLESLRLSPSSLGLQPWKFIVITDEKLRQRLREHARDQPQVTDASHLIVLCVRKDVNEDYIKNYVRFIAKTRNVALDLLKGYEEMMTSSRKAKSDEAALEWSKYQVYIALGFLLSACAQKRMDACPMEGFDNEKFDEILELGKEGLASVALCPVGYRGDDKYAHAKKVRFSKEDLFIFR